MVEDYLEYEHGEGYWEIADYELFYRRFGTGDDVLLGLHGGPGMPHDYLLPLAQHGSEDLTVYLYDQFGVGRTDSPAPGDFDRYTMDHYREEVEAIRQHLDPDGFHLYGQSWGGMLAQEYVLKYEDQVDSLILANTLAHSKTAFESMRSVLDELSEEDRELIEQYEEKHEFDDPEYESLLDKAYRNHVCRFDEYPRPVVHTFENINMDVYGLMWGPNEYILQENARLRDWDVRDEITGVTLPTQILTGSHDEISPDIAQDIANRLPNSSLREFTDSSHMAFWEQPEEHYKVVESFLSSHIT